MSNKKGLQEWKPFMDTACQILTYFLNISSTARFNCWSLPLI